METSSVRSGMETNVANTAVATHSARDLPLLTELEWCSEARLL